MEAGPKLMKELEGDDIGAASKALGQLPYEGRGRAVRPRAAQQVQEDRLLAAERAVEMAYRNRLEALGGLAYFGRPDPKLVKELITIIEDPENDFRSAEVSGATWA